MLINMLRGGQDPGDIGHGGSRGSIGILCQILPDPAESSALLRAGRDKKC